VNWINATDTEYVDTATRPSIPSPPALPFTGFVSVIIL